MAMAFPYTTPTISPPSFSKPRFLTPLEEPHHQYSSCQTKYISISLQTKHNHKPKSRILPSPLCATSTSPSTQAPAQSLQKPRILVAGGGIGGLVFALAARKKGFEVMVFERDVSAIRGEGQYRGPIQVQSNALAALEAIDMAMAEEVLREGCVTGDRINGLVDGISGSWYVKFDTFTPAAERGLPVTRVISRMTLQQILARAVGDDIILNDSNVVNFVDDGNKLDDDIILNDGTVVNFVDDGNKVKAMLENGQQFEGDMLVGADGIWSKVRKILLGPQEASYSGYTCYTGIADFVPVDIETVGYRVFLGHKQYFVSSDVGGGKMQWYAFHNEPAGGTDPPNGKKNRILQIFGDWCENVVDLINATDESAILRRDIYDRAPTLTWSKGRVTLLGDSIHAMQPNLGQGGCMAIEDGYQLAVELEKSWIESSKAGTKMDIASSLKRYEEERRLRVAVIHGMARMAAIMASTYRPYLGVGLGPFSFLTKLRIPHPGRVGGRFFIKIGMPLMLSWVLGGNSTKLEGRPVSCRLSDKASDQLQKWFEDDDELERAMKGEWFLIPVSSGNNQATGPIRLIKDENKPIFISNQSKESNLVLSLPLPSPQVSENHASITFKHNLFYLTDLGSENGTWLADNEGRRFRVPPNFPVRFHPSYIIEFGSDKKAMFRVKVLKAEKTNQGQNVLQVA